MKNLTEGPIVGHICRMAVPLAISMLAQFVLQFIDLYFIAKIGVSEIAGVNAVGNVVFISIALNQVIGIGTVALVSQAAGRNDRGDMRLILNQCMTIAIVCGLITVTLSSLFARPYLRMVTSDADTIDAGWSFLTWVLPGYALTFPMTVLGSALRGAGVVTQVMACYMAVVSVNIILAPILIAGWGTGIPLGVKGAALATSVSILIGFVLLFAYCTLARRWMALRWMLMRPRIHQWRRILMIGLPAGCDFGLFFFFTALVYFAIRDFGASAQAGFGIGSQVMQFAALPGLAIAFAAGPIAGQNFGARKAARVTETFKSASTIAAIVMVAITVLVQIQSSSVLSMFEADESALRAAEEFLKVTSWALVAQGVVSTCSSIFQGLGHTFPSLISSGVRLVTFAIPVIWMNERIGLRIEHVWYLSVASLMLQAATSLCLVAVEFRRRLLTSIMPATLLR